MDAPEDRIVLETERLLLRWPLPEDVEGTVALWTDADVMRFAGGPREPDKVRAAVLEEARTPRTELGQHSLWTTVDRSTGRVVGDCGLQLKTVDGVEEVEIAYFLAKTSWGRGFATEVACALRDHAFDAWDRERVIALINADNAASARVAAKAGLVLDRRTLRPSGEYREVWALDRKDRDRP